MDKLENDARYAVLIDADNVPEKYIKTIMDEISNYGLATYKRIYGDWTNTRLTKWKGVLLDNSITPVQQYGYTTGKNATDSAMIIDAMDILYSGNVDGFCLVTSDSDFTRLATRLRESGMDVVGMGERKTPRPFISACNRFKYLDIISETDHHHTDTKINKDGEGTEFITRTILSLIKENSDEDGWLFIGDLGNMLLKRCPDFDVRNFGYQKLTPFIKSLEYFEVKGEKIPGTNNKLIYIREL